MDSQNNHNQISNSNGRPRKKLTLDVNQLPKTDNKHKNMADENKLSSENYPQTQGNSFGGHDQESQPSFWSRIFSWRYLVILLLHSSFMISVFARNGMAIALVCMTAPTSHHDINVTHVSTKGNGTNYKESEDSEYEFYWDSETKGLILSAVSFLSFISPLISSFSSQRIGHRATLAIVTLIIAAIQVVLPTITRAGSLYLILLRFVLGATFGSNVPAMGDLVSKWAPANEKQTMITLVFTGLQTGGILMNVVSGYLCTIPIDNGWPFIFYLVAAMCVIWSVLWLWFSAAQPEDHKFISKHELDYIIKHREFSPPATSTTNGKSVESPPYKAIFTSIPVLAVVICSCAMFWSYSVFFAYQPMYLASVLKFSITQVGLIMTILSLCRLIGMIISTMIINKAIASRRWSVNRVKKTIMAVGMLMTICFQVMIIVVPSQYKYVVVVALLGLLFCQAAPAAILPGVAIDIAPRYAGFISAIFFSSGSLTGLTAPLLVAAMTPNSTEEEWRHVWMILGTMFVLIIIVFTTMADCRIQKWALHGPENAPPVTTSFDPMSHRLSIAMNTPPILPTVNSEDNNGFRFRDIELSILPVADSEKKHHKKENDTTCHELNGKENSAFVHDRPNGLSSHSKDDAAPGKTDDYAYDEKMNNNSLKETILVYRF